MAVFEGLVWLESQRVLCCAVLCCVCVLGCVGTRVRRQREQSHLTIFIFLFDIGASVEQFLDFGEIIFFSGVRQTHSLAHRRSVGVVA